MIRRKQEMLDKNVLISESGDLADPTMSPSYWAQMGRELIDKNYAHLHKVEDVCTILGISTGHFRDVFRMAYGINPKLYLARVKVEKAMELLKDTSVMVCDVAIKVGIPQRNVFKRTFKKFIGVTPSEYQRRSSINEIDPRK